jgi:hypothetical protein
MRKKKRGKKIIKTYLQRKTVHKTSRNQGKQNKKQKLPPTAVLNQKQITRWLCKNRACKNRKTSGKTKESSVIILQTKRDKS